MTGIMLKTKRKDPSGHIQYTVHGQRGGGAVCGAGEERRQCVIFAVELVAPPAQRRVRSDE
jgi:hypothetical protein